jgi:hypothetical protein
LCRALQSAARTRRRQQQQQQRHHQAYRACSRASDSQPS